MASIVNIHERYFFNSPGAADRNYSTHLLASMTGMLWRLPEGWHRNDPTFRRLFLVTFQ